ncbi:MAG: hypothetical protein SVS85_00780, partial [Candidatus Nanohaloarchaea archaeon]|nr:hypothetical protein [Candidatus Nanohaloarchaea archaeon]
HVPNLEQVPDVCSGTDGFNDCAESVSVTGGSGCYAKLYGGKNYQNYMMTVTGLSEFLWGSNIESVEVLGGKSCRAKLFKKTGMQDSSPDYSSQPVYRGEATVYGQSALQTWPHSAKIVGPKKCSLVLSNPVRDKGDGHFKGWRRLVVEDDSEQLSLVGPTTTKYEEEPPISVKVKPIQ